MTRPFHIWAKRCSSSRKVKQRTFIRTKNNLAAWLNFFLTAVIETTKKVLKLNMDLKILEFGKLSTNAKMLVDFYIKNL